MYLKRKIDDFLISWKDSSDKKPLIVKGARQIGKTKSIDHFAESYENSLPCPLLKAIIAQFC